MKVIELLLKKQQKLLKKKFEECLLHEDFHEPNKASIVADLNNYNNDELSDSNTASNVFKTIY